MSAYPDFHSRHVDSDGSWPVGMKEWSGEFGNLSNCPCCGQRWITYRQVDGKTGHNQTWYEDQRSMLSGKSRLRFLPPVPEPYPHVRYACGGVLREIDGYWSGKCWARKSQLSLALTGESE